MGYKGELKMTNIMKAFSIYPEGNYAIQQLHNNVPTISGLIIKNMIDDDLYRYNTEIEGEPITVFYGDGSRHPYHSNVVPVAKLFPNLSLCCTQVLVVGKETSFEQFEGLSDEVIEAIIKKLESDSENK